MMVVCAQAFHWFSTTSVLQEINRVLVPDGVLVVVFVKERDVPFLNELMRKAWQYIPVSTPDPPANYINDDWKNVFDEYSVFNLQEERKIYKLKFGGSLDFVLEYFNSFSFIALRSAEERSRIKEGLTAILKKHVETGGYIEIPLYEHIYIYVKQT